MSVSERIQLVEDIWDSIVSAPEEIPLSDAHRLELDYRLELFEKDPTVGSRREEVKPRIIKQK